MVKRQKILKMPNWTLTSPLIDLTLSFWEWPRIDVQRYKKTCFYGDLWSGEKAGSSMMELNNWFQRDWTWVKIRIGWFFIGRFTYKTGSWRNTGISEKTGYSEKKKRSWLTLDFARLSVDIGNSLWTVFLWILDFSGCLFPSINLYQMYNLQFPAPRAGFLVF